MNADNMNADRVNRWLTLGANVGVVIGLFLLLIEIDQTTIWPELRFIRQGPIRGEIFG